MRKYLKLLMLFLVSFSLVIAIAACTSNVSDIRQEDKADTAPPDNNKAVQTDTRPQYFFLDGSLLGSYEDGWHSLCDTSDSETGTGSTTFYAKDLLDQDSYYVYENNQLLGVSKQIIWITEEAFGLGSFESEDAPQKFAEYGELYHFEGDSTTAYRIFDLPLKLGNELSELAIPNYSFHSDFVFGEKWERQYSGHRLVTNSKVDLPKKLTYGIEPTTEGTHSLIDLFEKYDMENTIPNFNECIRGDFDNDGNEEYLMLAGTPESELGYPLLCSNGKTDHLGIFNVIFYQDDDGSIQTFYTDLRPYKGVFEADKDNNMELMGGPPKYCIRTELLTAADLNSDGVYEIAVKKSEWEQGFYLIYAMNAKGEYEVVMRSNFGM